MTAPVMWGNVAQQALAPYHVRRAARQAYGLATTRRRAIRPVAVGLNPALGQTGRSDTYWAAWGLISTASMAASAYHGYKRNDSLGWALVWAFCGALFPVITPVIAVAQGFGEPKRG